MTVETMTRHSPLEHRSAELAAVPSGLSARELPFLTQLNVRVDPDGPAAAALAAVLGTPLPTTPCTAVRTPDATILWLGPDEWLVLAPAGPDQLLDVLVAAVGEQGTVVDLSAHRTTIELSGALAREVLAKGCAVDLHPRVFVPGSCVQTLLARAPVALLALDGDVSTYWLLVRASFAGYVADWLLDASLEYGTPDR